MRTVEIGCMVDPVKKWNPKREGDGAFTYVDISSIDQHAKTVSEPSLVDAGEAPSRARQLIAAGDVLVSTVRPNLNAVAYVEPELDGATASTGYCVLRPRPGDLDGRYLFHWVRALPFISYLVQRATGASYPAVSDKIVKSSPIPLPPIAEQRRIATMLDAAEVLRVKRRQALARLGTLTQAVFLDMFGDPVYNRRGWRMAPLTELGNLDRGISKHRPRNDPVLLGGCWPLIQTGDVAASGGYITEFESTYSDAGLAQSKIWPSGTLCITIAANIAKTGILTFDACFPDSVVGFTAGREGAIEFVRSVLDHLQPILEQQAPESAQKNINLKVLRGLQVPIPPEYLMAEHALRIAAVAQQQRRASQQLEKLDTLFTSLQQRGFRGEL